MNQILRGSIRCNLREYPRTSKGRGSYLLPFLLPRPILHRVGVAAAALALNRIVSSAGTSVVFASGVHHAAAMAWLARLAGHRVTYADAAGFAVIEDLSCAGFMSFDSDFLLAGFCPWTPA